MGPPGGWCSSGAVKFEKSSGFIQSATNLRKKRSKIDKTFSSNGPNFFFEGAKLFFSWALFSFHDGLKNAYPAGTPQRTETKIASFPLSKIDKTFFFYGPNFFFWWPNFFLWGCFFLFLEGFFTFLSKLPDPNQKNNKRNCTGTAPPYRRAQRTNADRPRKARFPVATCLFFVESVYHRPGALPPDPRRGDTPRTPRGLRKVLLQKSATPVIFGLLARLDYAGSTQLDELRRSS